MLRHRSCHFLFTIIISQLLSYFISFFHIPIRFYPRCFPSLKQIDRTPRKFIAYILSSSILSVYGAQSFGNSQTPHLLLKFFFQNLLFMPAPCTVRPVVYRSITNGLPSTAVDKSINNFHWKSRGGVSVPIHFCAASRSFGRRTTTEKHGGYRRLRQQPTPLDPTRRL